MSILLIVRTEMYAGCIACCPLVSHGEHANRTDGQTPECYTVLSARCSECNNNHSSMIMKQSTELVIN